MKTYIKIALIIIAILSIVTIILFTIQSNVDAPSKGFDPKTAFEESVLKRVKNNIEDKSYQEASKTFDEICNEIQTEKAITLADGKKKVSESEISRCYKLLFDSYSPIFIKHANEEINRSSWNDAELMSLSSRASQLASMGLAKSGTTASAEFNKVNAIVSEYAQAKEAAASGAGCTNAAQVNAVITNCEKFKHDPLTKNAALMQALDGAEARAKQSFEQYVIGNASKVANSYRAYGSFESFDAVRQNAVNLVNGYVNAFGSTGGTNNALAQLNSSRDQALDYFVSLQERYEPEYDYDDYDDYDW